MKKGKKERESRAKNAEEKEIQRNDFKLINLLP